VCVQVRVHVHVLYVNLHSCDHGLTATHCNTLQHTATHHTTLQHAAAQRNTPHCTATHYNTLHLDSNCHGLGFVADNFSEKTRFRIIISKYISD